jgi:hypothetical protein
MSRNTATAAATASSRVRTDRRRSSCRAIRGDGRPTRREPVEVMISVRLRSRSGARIATLCATNPPMEAPTRSTVPRPSASISPSVSRARSSIAYGAFSRRRRTRPGCGAPRWSRWLDRPQSRLSKRTT